MGLPHVFLQDTINPEEGSTGISLFVNLNEWVLSYPLTRGETKSPGDRLAQVTLMVQPDSDPSQPVTGCQPVCVSQGIVTKGDDITGTFEVGGQIKRAVLRNSGMETLVFVQYFTLKYSPVRFM